MRNAEMRRSEIRRARARISSRAFSTLAVGLHGSRQQFHTLTQKLKGLGGQTHQAMKYRVAVMVREWLGRERWIHEIRTERQGPIGHPSAEQMSGVEIATNGFVGVRGNLRVAKVERMMAPVGAGEVALLTRQRRFEKLADGIQGVVP